MPGEKVSHSAELILKIHTADGQTEERTVVAGVKAIKFVLGEAGILVDEFMALLKRAADTES